MCEPEAYLRRTMELAKTQHKNLNFAQFFLEPLGWKNVHGEFLAYPKLSSEKQQLLNDTLFDLSHHAFTLHVQLNDPVITALASKLEKSSTFFPPRRIEFDPEVDKPTKEYEEYKEEYTVGLSAR